MIDLHTHILPGVDDGVETLDGALALVRRAREDGITTMVATPHRNPRMYSADRVDAERRLEVAREACRHAGLDVRILLGGESFMAPDLVEQVDSGLALTINGGRYLLIEWPYDQYAAYGEEIIFRLQAERRIVPIMAHAERYSFVSRNLRDLARLVHRGLLVQVTAASLLGEFGPEIQRVTERLLTSGLAHVIASDSRGVDHRPPMLSAARDRAAKLVGEARAQAMVTDVPRRIIDDEAIDVPPPTLARSKPFWAFWKS